VIIKIIKSHPGSPGFRNFAFYILIFDCVRGLQAAIGIEVLVLLFI